MYFHKTQVKKLIKDEKNYDKQIVSPQAVWSWCGTVTVPSHCVSLVQSDAFPIVDFMVFSGQRRHEDSAL